MILTRIGDWVWILKEDDRCKKTFGELCGTGGILTG